MKKLVFDTKKTQEPDTIVSLRELLSHLETTQAQVLRHCLYTCGNQTVLCIHRDVSKAREGKVCEINASSSAHTQKISECRPEDRAKVCEWKTQREVFTEKERATPVFTDPAEIQVYTDSHFCRAKCFVSKTRPKTSNSRRISDEIKPLPAIILPC
jgi:hypothetical protein